MPKLKPSTLSSENYYTQENLYLSYSRLKDWKLDRRYFYERHIERSLQPKVTDAMINGKALDVWLTQGKEAYEKQFQPVKVRNHKEPPTEYQEITFAQHETISRMANAVMRTTAFSDLLDHTAQEILAYDIDLKYFMGLCGIPDWYKVEGDTCTVTDLKSSQAIDPVKYYWQAVNLSYFLQQAVYQLLLSEKYPEIKYFVSRHLVVSDNGTLARVKAFILPQEVIEEEKLTAWEMIKEIKAETEFAPTDADFDTATLLTGIRTSEGDDWE